MADVISFKVKPSPPEFDSPEYFSQKFAFIVEIKNNTSSVLSYNLNVVFEDNDGFELANEIAFIGYEIRPNETVKESGSVDVNNREAGKNYKEINCVLKPRIQY